MRDDLHAANTCKKVKRKKKKKEFIPDQSVLIHTLLGPALHVRTPRSRKTFLKIRLIIFSNISFIYVYVFFLHTQKLIYNKNVEIFNKKNYFIVILISYYNFIDAHHSLFGIKICL